MTIETVSRTFANLRKDGMVAVDQREIRILRPDELQTLASGGSCSAARPCCPTTARSS